jgi:CRISPR/Cas system CSM-associated protein Csm3 (group 7 of RAMP superfamily)
MNPYDFVRLPERVDRKRPTTHEALRGKCGAIRCRLTAITSILVAAGQAHGGPQRFLTSRYSGNELPAIPGSSLKGVIRSVSEAVSNSCIGLSGELFFFDRKASRLAVADSYRDAINKELLTCNRADSLCPACRLFGMVSNKSHIVGKVSIGEARTMPEGFKRGQQIILKPLMEPKTRHTAFYLPGGKVAGRKFYFHHSGPLKTTNQPTEFTRTVVPLEGIDNEGRPQTVFEFDVTFQNLTDDEYALLLFSLFLKEDMRHKVGAGKPSGLGTAKIELVYLRLIEPKRRYEGLAKSATEPECIEGGTAARRIEEATASICSHPSPSLLDLERIWRYPPAKGADGKSVDYKYPDQDWFNRNSAVPLSGTP